LTNVRPAEGVEAHNGWSVFYDFDKDGDGFEYTYYEAQHPELGSKFLNLSFSFNLTQERFNFFVDNDFPQREVPCKYGQKGMVGVCWTDASVDEKIAECGS
jgi:hypothetical protein